MNIEYQYAHMLRPYLDGFVVKKTQPLLINFRCPFCGDSKTKESRKRGYIIQEGNGKYYYYCHKCRVHGYLWQLIKHFSPILYGEYRLALLRDQRPEALPSENAVKDPLAITKQTLESHPTLKNILSESLRSNITDSSKAVDYLINRKIPNHHLNDLYFCSDYAQLMIDLGYEKAHEFSKGKQRVIIPSYAPDGTLIMVDGRALDPDENPRYIKCVLTDKWPTVYGLNRLDTSKPMWFFEGQFDSMFVNNGAAIGGSHRTQLFDHYFDPYKENIIFVTDNEPRNKFVLKEVKRNLERGYKVVLWPNHFKSKDLNDMIISGEVDINNVEEVLTANIHKGLTGLAKLAEWSK